MLGFLFTYTEPLRAGDYLMGSPKWTEAVSLRNARVTCLAGQSRGGGASGTGQPCLSPTVLQLEVNGELIDKTIPILPLVPGERINSVVALNRVLPAGSELRIKCVRAPAAASPAYEDCIREVGVNLECGSATGRGSATGPDGGTGGGSGSGLLAPSAVELYVMWVHGQEQMRLFDYLPASASGTCLFTESVPGRAAGRASIVNGPNCEIQIQGEAALKIGSDQVLRCGWFIASGSTTWSAAPTGPTGSGSATGSAAPTGPIGSGSATGEPRLEFWRGGQGQIPPQRLATLTKSGQLVTVDLVELASAAALASVAGGNGNGASSNVQTGLGFTFLGNGVPAAVIGPVKCMVLGLKEGWISPFDRLTSDGFVRVTNDGMRRVGIWGKS